MSKEEAYNHILSIMYLDDTSIDSLKASKVSTVRILEMTLMDTFDKMASDNTLDFTMADADQIYFFQQWFTLWSLKSYIKDTATLTACFTEK